MKEYEAYLVKRYFDEAGGSVAKAAKAAGMCRQNFYKTLRRNGIEPLRVGNGRQGNWGVWI